MMLCDLSFDILATVAMSLRLRDALSLGQSSKFMHTCTVERARMAKVSVGVKRAMWEVSPPVWLDDFRERRVQVHTSEWAKPGFDMEQARHCFNRVVDWVDPIDPKQLVLCATGTRADTDETIRKLVQWMPEECKGVVTLWVHSDRRTRHTMDTTRTSVHDGHLLPFSRAQGLSICECDSITDAGVACFTHLTRLMVDECGGIDGDCLETLVTSGSLRRADWWYHRLEPREVAPEPSSMIKTLIASGALRLTCKRDTRPNSTVEEAYKVD